MSFSKRVAVVATVRNESATILRLLDSLMAQSRPPDEVVVVDGGSTDGTWERLQTFAGRLDLPFKATVLRDDGANISAGRNLAIRTSTAEIIAVTDAGVELPPGWLERIIAPLSDRRATQIAAGFFAADPRGAFETALGATTLPLADEIRPATFLPSSRSVAFSRHAFDASGGYPEWLDYCEDLIFDMRLIHFGGAPVFVPDAEVRFQPRPTLAAFYRQYYLYARGDGKANLWLWRHLLRYATYLVAVPVLVGLALASHPAWLLVGAGGFATMLRRPYRRLFRTGSVPSRQRLDGIELVCAALWIPAIQITGDVAKMLGYPVGRLWRRRHHPPEWRPTPELGRW